MSDSFEIIYAAHTATCTFLLDSEGMCRKIVLASSSKRPLSQKSKDAARAAQRCVGAQYVASLDPSVSGMLAEMPRIGASMLFARVDERGRVSLVRTGVVTRFESHRDNPFHGMQPTPSESVATSAPLLTPSSAGSSRPHADGGLPRRARETMPPPDPYREPADRPTVIPKVSASEFMRISDESLADVDLPPDFESQTTARRATWPSPSAANLSPPQPATLRQPTPVPVADDDEREHDPYTAIARGVLPPPPLPRRSETYLSRPRNARGSEAPPPPPRVPSYPPLDKVAAPRRRGS